MDLEKIRELVKLVEESQIQELELGSRGETIRISKSGSVVSSATTAPQAPAPVASVAAAPAAAAPPADASASGDSLRGVESPMVGTFYGASSPDDDPFVKVGTQVAVGDVLCIIEAMKVMNEIEAETAGTIREVCLDNGQPVEFGQVLFRIEAS